MLSLTICQNTRLALMISADAAHVESIAGRPVTRGHRAKASASKGQDYTSANNLKPKALSTRSRAGTACLLCCESVQSCTYVLLPGVLCI